MSANWKWDLTQYSADSTTRPSAGEIYMLEFSDNDKLRVVTECGTRKGKYNARGSHIAIEIGRGLFSGCRNDPAMNVFLADLERARDIYLEEGRLRIRLSGDSGIMFFDKKG
jgi:hypothetical protein